MLEHFHKNRSDLIYVCASESTFAHARCPSASFINEERLPIDGFAVIRQWAIAIVLIVAIVDKLTLRHFDFNESLN